MKIDSTQAAIDLGRMFRELFDAAETASYMMPQGKNGEAHVMRMAHWKQMRADAGNIVDQIAKGLIR